MKITIASLHKFARSHGFQRFIKELTLALNLLTAGTTMGARRRRQEMMTLLSKAHALLKDQAKTMKDEEAFAEIEKQKEVSLKNIKDASEKAVATKELPKAAKAAAPKSSEKPSEK